MQHLAGKRFRASRSVLSRFERIRMLLADGVCEMDCRSSVRVVSLGMTPLRFVDARDGKPRIAGKIRVGNVALRAPRELERLSRIGQRRAEQVRVHRHFGASDQRTRAGSSAAALLRKRVDHLGDR